MARPKDEDSPSEAKDQKDQPFEQILSRLNTVVSQLEDGNLSLENALLAYEEGVKLTRQGHELLARAEKRIEVLVRSSKGNVESVPFDETTPSNGAG